MATFKRKPRGGINEGKASRSSRAKTDERKLSGRMQPMQRMKMPAQTFQKKSGAAQARPPLEHTAVTSESPQPNPSASAKDRSPASDRAA